MDALLTLSKVIAASVLFSIGARALVTEALGTRRYLRRMLRISVR